MCYVFNTPLYLKTLHFSMPQRIIIIIIIIIITEFFCYTKLQAS